MSLMTSRASVAMGNAIQSAMFQRRMNQSDLAEKMGIHQTTLSKKLRGQRPWDIDDVLSAADAMGIDAVELLRTMWSYAPAPESEPGFTNRSMFTDLLTGRFDAIPA